MWLAMFSPTVRAMGNHKITYKSRSDGYIAAPRPILLVLDIVEDE
jgi:hypothetical protein